MYLSPQACLWFYLNRIYLSNNFNITLDFSTLILHFLSPFLTRKYFMYYTYHWYLQKHPFPTLIDNPSSPTRAGRHPPSPCIPPHSCLWRPSSSSCKLATSFSPPNSTPSPLSLCSRITTTTRSTAIITCCCCRASSTFVAYTGNLSLLITG